jgi:hypothetical protein
MFTLLLMLSHALSFPDQGDIYLEVTGQSDPNSPWVFFSPHENEFVANQYVAKQVNKKGGVFYVLRQRGEREITFEFNQNGVKKSVIIDPNRMFSDKGIKESIEKLNPNLPPQSALFKKAVKRAHALKTFVLNQLGENKTWLAVHNNTDGYEGDDKGGLGDVSIVRYQTKLNQGAQYLIDVSYLGLTQNNIDEDDLYFVTQQQDFDAMQNSQWNVLLQNPIVTSDPEEDDGSLSVYAQMHNIRYINIEAERIKENLGTNHLEVQKKMIDFTFDLLTLDKKQPAS